MENVIEVHPWNRFPSEDGKSTKLILGSFPPARFTPQFKQLLEGDKDFFYGSKDNSFWELFFYALNEPELALDPYPEKIKNYLEKNRWAISDIVLKTNRGKSNSAADSDLRIKDYNIDCICELFKHNEIKVVFFTSRWVQQRFERNIEPYISQKVFDKITLISPSPSGLRRMEWATGKLAIGSTESKSGFRQRYYQNYLGPYATNQKESKR